MGIVLSVVWVKPVRALDIYLSTSKVEQSVHLRQKTIMFDPTGLNGYLSLNISEPFSISVNYGKWQQDNLSTDLLTADIDISTYGGAFNYDFSDNWYVAASYNVWEDEIKANTNRQRTIYNEKNDSESYSMTLGWGIEFDFYYLNLSSSIQTNHWQSNQSTIIPRAGAENLIQKIDTTFASFTIDGSHYLPFNENYALVYGAQLSWYQLLSDDSISDRNIRRVRQNNPQRNNISKNISISNYLSTEDYGQIGLYAMLLLGEA